MIIKFSLSLPSSPIISPPLLSSPLPSPSLTSQLLAADLTEEKQECVEKIKPLVEEMGPKVSQEPIIQVHMSMQRGYWVVDIMHHYGKNSAIPTNMYTFF